MFVMSEAQRGRVHPFRGEAAAMPDAGEGARRVRLFWRVEPMPGVPKLADVWERGLALAAAPYGERTRAAISLLEDPSGPARDPLVEAVLMAMLDYGSRRGMVMKEAQGGSNDRFFPVDAWFVQRWLAAGGVPFALRVIEAFPRVDIDRHTNDRTTYALSIKPRDGEAWWCLEVGHLGLLHVLRRAVATCGDYAAGVTEAARIREAAPPWLRAGLAFVFPDEPFWQADLRDATPTKKGARLPAEAWGLAMTAVDESALAPILDSMARDAQSFVTDTAYYGYTLVKRFGDGAARHLLGYLATAKDAWSKEMMGDALALTQTPETRAFFETKLKDRALGKLAKAYVKNA